tara:strand:+ start:140 stop:1009 length:870 start_codon:yes stop_codon:yes gene_type:complete
MLVKAIYKKSINFIEFLKNFLYFIINIFDFKFDFPIPPKPFYRVFKPIFWTTFLKVYKKRKQYRKKYEEYEKQWVEEIFLEDDYMQWLLKTFNKQYFTTTNDKIYKKIFAARPTKILEVGCGGGNTGAAFLINYLNYLNNSKNLNEIIEYTGIDLSETRIENAKKKLPIFFSAFKNILNINLISSNGSIVDKENQYFQFTFAVAVLEQIDDIKIEKIVKEMSRVTKKYIYVSDLMDHYPGGFPRSHKVLDKIFNKYNFKLIDHDYSLQTIKKNTDSREYCYVQYIFERV